MNKQALSRPLGRCVGLDVHLDFIEIAICEEGKVYSVGRVAATPKGIQTLADSLLPTDRVAREVTGSSWEIVRLLEPHVSRVIVVPFGDWQIAKFAAACAGCPLADRCTSAKEGRTVYVGSFEQQLARVRQRQSDPACKADYKATQPKV